MHLRRTLASGLAALALLGVGAVVTPAAAQAATPTCAQALDIRDRTVALITRKSDDANRHYAQGNRSLADREMYVAKYYAERLRKFQNQYSRCMDGTYVGFGFATIKPR